MALRNTRQEQFLQNIAIGRMKPGEAWIAASGDPKPKLTSAYAAARFALDKIEVRNRLEYLQERNLEKTIAGANFVEAGLKEIVDRCMQAKPHLDKAGRPDGQWVADHTNATKALRIIGEGLGLWIQKVEVTNPDQATDGKDDAAVRKMAMALLLDLGRPFFLQAAEEVFGLTLTDGGEGPDGDTSSPERPVHTLQ